MQVKLCSIDLIRDECDKLIDLSRRLSATMVVDHDADCAASTTDTDQESALSEAQVDDILKPIETAEIESTESSNESVLDALAQDSSPATAAMTTDTVPLKRKRIPKKVADLIPTNEIPISPKRRKTPTLKSMPPIKKPLKPKPRPQLSICFLCGAQFQSGIQLTQHQKTHFAGTTSQSPVFPCNVCGRQVKNLKMHLRQHKIEDKQNAKQESHAQQQPPPPPQQQQPIKSGVKGMKAGKRSKSNESQKSNGPSKTGYIKKRARAQMTESSGNVAKAMGIVKLTAVMPSDTLVKRAEASSSTDAVFSKILCDTSKGTELISSNEASTNSTDANASAYNLIGESLIDTGALLRTSNEILLPPPAQPSTPTTPLATSSSLSPLFAPSAIDPLNMPDPFHIQLMDGLEPISVNEPSQSTSAIVESINAAQSTITEYLESTIEYHTFESNGMSMNAVDQVEQHQANGDQATTHSEWYKCPKCPRLFDSLANVTKHSKKHDEKMNCKLCGKLLAKSYVKFHVSKYHKSGNVNIPMNIGDGEDDDVDDDDEAADTA